MESDRVIPSSEINLSGKAEKDNLLSSSNHRTNCIDSETDQGDVEILVNGLSSDPSNQEQQQVVTPEMLYKLSKKIAQLTKVILI